MDEMRKAFEAWAQGCGWDISKIGSDRSGTYESMFTRSMWWAWQAACAVEREACAQVCEAYALRTSGYLDNDMTAVKFADAIRARSQQ